MNVQIRDSVCRDAVYTICSSVHAEGGSAFLVGGCVRDSLLKIHVKDLDIEVHGIPPDRLEKILSERFALDQVGRAFGVLKIRHLPIDIALPRRESKAGLGHRGFTILSDPHMPIEEAASRRDFTINAMAYNPLTDSLEDPFHGQNDLHARILRHTSDKFTEDPLRVLRGMQFVARFELTPAPETIELCRTLTPADLSPERIFEEWKKLILQGQRPSLGLQFLQDTGWLTHFPELAALAGCPQEPRWHPEGDVWTHTLHSMDAFAMNRIQDSQEDLIVGLAVLCHDFGKPGTTTQEEKGIRSRGHPEAGEQPTRQFLNRMTNQEDLIQSITRLVLLHMRPMDLYKAKSGDAAIRRLAAAVERIDRLVRVAAADHKGRPPRSNEPFLAGEWLMEQAHRLSVQDSRPKPFVQGRHLIAIGMEPGPDFKRYLDQCYEAQLDGKIQSEADGIRFLTQIRRLK